MKTKTNKKQLLLRMLMGLLLGFVIGYGMAKIFKDKTTTQTSTEFLKKQSYEKEA